MAAYLGYTNTGDLRKLMATWPVLQAYIKYEPLAQKMSYYNAFVWLNDDLEAFSGHENPIQAFPPIEGETETQTKTRLDKQLAAIISKLVTDMETMATNTKEANQQHQEECVILWDNRFPSFEAPKINFDGAMVFPNLGPISDQETHMEPMNRAMQLLRTLRTTLQNASLRGRFSQLGLSGSTTIHETFVPLWMREKPAVDTSTVTPLAAVRTADQLKPRTFLIVWNTELDEENDDLVENLKQAEGSGIVLSQNSPLELQVDPRLFASIEPFRDMLRRLFRCEDLRMNIRWLYLEWRLNGVHQKINTLGKSWEQVLEILDMDTAREHVFEVGFYPKTEEEMEIDGIFETDDLPPSTGQHFPLQPGDV